MALNITFISNVIFEPYIKNCLCNSFLSSKADINFTHIPYEEFEERIKEAGEADITVISLNFDSLYPDYLNKLYAKTLTVDEIIKDCTRKCGELYTFVKAHSKGHVFWLGFEDYCNKSKLICGNVYTKNDITDKLNIMLSDTVDTLIDFKSLISDIGRDNAYDIKGKYRWNAPYSKNLIQRIADEVYKQYMIHSGRTKKCLVLDCDNVLWGGILSEDGIDKIQISNTGPGHQFSDFQSFILTMYYSGVIIAVCSKNDEKDVLKVFREHSGMILKEEHIACFMCNWDNKPCNIGKISEILNIGLDSMVFVDDSPFELEAVKEILPEVATVLYQRDTIFKALSCFNLKSDADESTVRNRIETYKTDIKRNELKNSSSSFEEYLRYLDMKLDIHPAKENEISRISELTQRTNKCTNGQRYTAEQLKDSFFNGGASLLTVCLSDKFSDLGIVGVIGIQKNTAKLFSLSCRALGRNIEEKLITLLKDSGIVNIRFKPTDKNDGFKDMLLNAGFIIEERNSQY